MKRTDRVGVFAVIVMLMAMIVLMWFALTVLAPGADRNRARIAEYRQCVLDAGSLEEERACG